jgi:hypothetical protein
LKNKTSITEADDIERQDDCRSVSNALLSGIRIAREWGMPTADTFDCPPIATFVQKYLQESNRSVDPFARNKQWATVTNDLNPDTAADHHEDAAVFLRGLVKRGERFDLVIFDPPYSPRQIKECYDGIGKKMEQMDAFRTHWKPERDAIIDLMDVGGVVLSFGWNSNGMGRKRMFRIEEMLIVAHGPGHNDTICMAERKLAHQGRLFAR